MAAKKKSKDVTSVSASLSKAPTFDQVMKNFPKGRTPRELQVEAIRQTCDAFQAGHQYVVLDAPTGVGKSLIGMAFAKAFGTSWMLTLTEQLQDQYLKDFPEVSLLKGRGKFNCTYGGGMSCKEGKHHSKSVGVSCHAPGKGRMCPYVVARLEALEADITVANYHAFLWNIGASSRQKEESDDRSARQGTRRLMILDEAHALENFLLDQVGITVKMAHLGGIDLADPPEEEFSAQPYFNWMEEELVPALIAAEKSTVDPRKLDDLGMLRRKVESTIARKDSEEWIPEREKNESDGKLVKSHFTLKPLTVSSYGSWIHGHGERVLLMSATVLNAYQLTSSIGLDPDKGHHVELPSPFPKENRPIVVSPMNMSFGARFSDDPGGGSWPAMVARINGIMKHHRADKGLILTTSNAMLKYILKNLDRENSTRLIAAFGEDRVQKYNQHVAGKMPTVLIASGYWEGADLKDDSSRFQIIPSVPRGMWHGQIKARAQMSSSWYRWLNFSKMLQGMGRSVRSETDEAITYIFDQDFVNEMERSDSMIPKWVKEAVDVRTPKAAAE